MENFLFQLELDQNASIFLPRVDAIMHLPKVRIPPRTQKKVTIKFTDGQRKKLVHGHPIKWNNVYSYVIVKGWEEFVQKHKLGAMDVIKFYKHVNPSHKNYFLIEILKNSGWGANRAGPRQGGSSKGNEIARE